jgi:hypothetical protein
VALTLEEIARPFDIEVWMNGPGGRYRKICTDPRPQRYQVNFRLPEDVGPGLHHIHLNIGRRKLAPVPVEVMV